LVIMKITIPPEAAGTVEALSQIGYSPESAICDIVDNSVQAGASYIEINTNPAENWLEIRDNGCGMDNDEVREALIYGKKTSKSKSLGKFGIGLKTAATGLGKRVKVYSAKYNPVSEVTDMSGSFILDTDHIKKENKWEAIREETESDVKRRFYRRHNSIENFLTKKDPSHASLGATGTVIRIEKLKNLLGKDYQDRTGKPYQKAIKEFKERLREYLGRVYYHFLKDGAQGKIYIEFDGKLVDPVNPLDSASLVDSLTFSVPGVNYAEEVTAHVYKDAQDSGVYLYREGRLIEHGRLLFGIKRDSRVIVVFEYSENLDNVFTVDVQKSKVDPKLDSDIIDELAGIIKKMRKEKQESLPELEPVVVSPSNVTAQVEEVTEAAVSPVSIPLSDVESSCRGDELKEVGCVVGQSEPVQGNVTAEDTQKDIVQTTSCTGPITLEECVTVLKSLDAARLQRAFELLKSLA